MIYYIYKSYTKNNDLIIRYTAKPDVIDELNEEEIILNTIETDKIAHVQYYVKYYCNLYNCINNKNYKQLLIY